MLTQTSKMLQVAITTLKNSQSQPDDVVLWGNLCGRVLHWKLLCKRDQCGWTAGRRRGLQGRLKSELCALLYDFTWFDKFSPMIPHISCVLLVSKLPSTKPVANSLLQRVFAPRRGRCESSHPHPHPALSVPVTRQYNFLKGLRTNSPQLKDQGVCVCEGGGLLHN